MQEILRQIRDYADRAHGMQVRKYTAERYIVHPVRVMEICGKYTKDICMSAAALLHDVLEDTEVTKDELEYFLFTVLSKADVERTLRLVVDLTDVYVKKDYPKLNRRSRKNKELVRLEKTSADSQTIKYADIIDNTREIVQHDRDFARVYLYECKAILRKLDKGNPELYKRAFDVVNEAISLIR